MFAIEEDEEAEQGGENCIMRRFIIFYFSAIIINLSRYSDGLRAGRPLFDYRQGYKIFLYSTA
jgi:hypothetical protein